jgi:hypothetical protein
MRRWPSFFVLIASLLGPVAHAESKPASYRPRAPSFDAARARLLQPKSDGATIRAKLGIKPGTWSSQSLAGEQIQRTLPAEQAAAVGPQEPQE